MPGPLNGVEIIEFLPELDSTNRLAKEYMRAGQVEGKVVQTGYQYQGRGQQGTTWLVERDQNLTFSVVLRPSFLASTDLFQLNQVAALAVSDTLAAYFPVNEIRIKWPNDILVRGKKICGILIETQLEGSRLSGAVAGIGLNVNQAGFPDNLRFPPTSMKIALGDTFDLHILLRILLDNLWARYAQLSFHREKIQKDYLALLYGLHMPVWAEVAGKKGLGVIRGVDHYGRLRMDWQGAACTFDLKEVRLFPPIHDTSSI